MIDPAWPEIAAAAPPKLHHPVGHDLTELDYQTLKVHLGLGCKQDEERRITSCHLLW